MSILILAQVETSPSATARWGTLLLLGLSLACVVAWSGVLRRVASGQPLFAPVSQGEVPWGLTDLLVIAAFWLAAILATSVLAGGAQQPDSGPARLEAPKMATDEAEPASAANQAGDPGAEEQLMPPLRLFLISSLFLLLACAASMLYLHSRYGREIWSFLGLNQWSARVKLGLLGFILAMPLAIWLMSILVRFFPYKHPSLDVLARSPTPLVIIAIWGSAGLVAPLVEEFFFRYILQSWLFRIHLRDSMGHRLQVLYGDEARIARRDDGSEQPAVRSRALWPIAVSSLLFASMHWGQGPAPIALFVFALALGYVFHRSGSLIPCVVMHMLLNVYSLTLATLAAWEARGA